MSHVSNRGHLFTAQEVIDRLEDAGRTLLALPGSGCRPAEYGNGWPAVVHAAVEAYGYTDAQVRPAVPSAQAISRMDQTYRWIGMLTDQQQSYRRIVLLRSLVHPNSGRHMFSWRKIARQCGWDYRAVQNWHAKGIDLIVAALRRQTLQICSK